MVVKRAVSFLTAIVIAAPVFVSVGAGAHTEIAVPASCGEGKPTSVRTGTFTTELEGAFVLIPFRVPRPATKVRIRLCYDQPESPTSSNVRHTLDLGLYEPRGKNDRRFNADEFRGWGGSSRPDLFVSPKAATLGFIPGPVPGGRWAAELGVAAVAGQDEGDAGGDVSWRLEIFLTNHPADTKPRWRPTPYDTTPAVSRPGWYAGDFHVHAEHSDPGDPR